MLPNRIAVYLTAAAALLGGLAPAVANLDLQSSAGIVAGIAGVVAVARKWLEGWQQHEYQKSYQDHEFLTKQDPES